MDRWINFSPCGQPDACTHAVSCYFLQQSTASVCAVNSIWVAGRECWFSGCVIFWTLPLLDEYFAIIVTVRLVIGVVAVVVSVIAGFVCVQLGVCSLFLGFDLIPIFVFLISPLLFGLRLLNERSVLFLVEYHLLQRPNEWLDQP